MDINKTILARYLPNEITTFASYIETNAEYRKHTVTY